MYLGSVVALALNQRGLLVLTIIQRQQEQDGTHAHHGLNCNTHTMSDPLDILPTDPAAAGGLDASTTTFPSDSENYSSEEHSPSPPSSSSPLILYSPPTFWGLIRGAAINLLLPFVNGLMLGFGELVANEAAYRLGWSGTKVCLDLFAMQQAESQRQGNRANADVCRSSPLDEQIRGALAPAWRCVQTQLRGGGGMGRSWTCTPRWSRLG